MRKFFTKKKIIWTAIIVLLLVLIGWRIAARRNSAANIQTDVVKKQDLKSTVLATGQVVSSTDLDLSFKVSGFVQKIGVQEGDKVKAGDILATLDQKDAQAGLTTAQGALAQAQANYQKVLSGASSQDVAVSQSAVDSAQVTLNTAKTNLQNVQAQQATAVSNAYSALLNSTLSAIPAATNLSGTNVVGISGTYTGADQGVYTIKIYSTGSGQYFQTSGLEAVTGQVKASPVAMGSRGLYVQFNSLPYNGDTWTVNIPNTSAANYVANYNAYQAALQTQQSALASAQAQVDSAQAALAQAQAALDLKTAQARPADIDAAKAAIVSAQGQVLTAQAALENTIIRAPADGTITSVDIKVGELATAMQEAIVLQDISSLHVEADVSEANIASIQPGQSVDVTFDALGPDRHFNATVQTVNPGATVVSGVVDYKVKASLDNVPDIKPGMTANMIILVAQKGGALAVPSRAVIQQDNGKFVRRITDSKKKSYEQVPVTTGLEADGGLTEITSGLSEGDEVVTYIN
ncbi:MAG TPA: efflux RND transporter periplasmic adaptor subunit [Patescibacteria group bacterium]|nr:efflux RND transporter periplasmic adaptor subunit [Patescibacteria group bacterium]